MRRILLVGMALAICACSARGAGTAAVQAPPLSRSGAEQLMLKADDIKRSVLDGAQVARLAAVFAGPALQMLAAQASTMDARRQKQDERSTARLLVFWDSHAGEAVLQVTAQRRLVTPDQPDPAWAITVRQWWARIELADGGWRVSDQHDLPPDQWRRVPPPDPLATATAPGEQISVPLTGWVPYPLNCG